MMTKFLKSIFATIAIALLASLANQLYADTPKKEKSRIDVIKQRSHEPERDITCYVEAFYGLNSIEVYDENIQNIKLNAMYGYRIRGEKYIDCVKRKTEVLLEEFEDSHSKFQEIVLGDFAAGVAAYCAILGCTEYEDQVI